jgi:hypothetical protein
MGAVENIKEVADLVKKFHRGGVGLLVSRCSPLLLRCGGKEAETEKLSKIEERRTLLDATNERRKKLLQRPASLEQAAASSCCVY